MSAEPEPTNVAFMSYFVKQDDLAVLDPRFQGLSSTDRSALLERVHRQITPRVVRRHRIRSRQGMTVDLLTIGLSATSELIEQSIRRGESSWLRERVREGLEVARAEGCTIMGLAGYLSILTDNGLDVVTPEIGVTTGNSLSVAAAVAGIELAAKRIGLNLAESRVAIVGAGGNIGSSAARMLAPCVRTLDLVGRFPGSPSLDLLAAHLRSQGYETWSANMTALKQAQVVLSATSSPTPIITASHLSNLTRIVCDVAVPGDVGTELDGLRPDIEIIRGGVFALPGSDNEDFTLNNLPLGHAYACMTETVVLGFERHVGNYSVGPILAEDAQHVFERACWHGMGLRA